MITADHLWCDVVIFHFRVGGGGKGGGWLGIPFRSSAVSTLFAGNIKDYSFYKKET